MSRRALDAGQAAVEAVVAVPAIAVAALGLVGAASHMAAGLAVSAAAHDAAAIVVAGGAVPAPADVMPAELADDAAVTVDAGALAVVAPSPVSGVVPVELPELRATVAIEGSNR